MFVRIQCVLKKKKKQAHLGTDHLTFNLKGGVMVFCFVQNFFSGQHKS